MTARRRLLVLALCLLVLVAVVLVLAAQGVLTPGEARAWADREIREPVDDLGPAGPLAFVALMALATVLLFPGPVMAGASGLLFGTALGFPVTLATIVLGGTLAFGLARWWAHDAVEELAGGRVRDLREWVGRRGFLSVLYSRITPGVPYNLVNYAAGLAPVRPLAFVAATALGAAPRSFAYTALGGSFGDLRSPEAIVAVAVLVGVGLLGIALGLRERRRVTRAAGSAAATSSRAGRSAGRR